FEGNLTVHSSVIPELVKTGHSGEHLKQLRSWRPEDPDRSIHLWIDRSHYPDGQESVSSDAGSIDPPTGSIDPTPNA
ncbi:unnamed protein product, partial [Arabidopsis halleri]